MEACVKVIRRIVAFLYRLKPPPPHCLARVDQGSRDLPPNKWELCGRRSSLCRGIFMDGTWNAIVPLCAEHGPQPAGPPHAPQWAVPKDPHIGVHLQFWNECLDIALHPFAWFWWGTYPTNPGCFYLGPLAFGVRPKKQ